MFLQSISNAALEKALSATWQRGAVISHNIANEDTPGYKAKRLDFETALSKEISALKDTKGKARSAGIERINSLQPDIYSETGTAVRADGNNVDINAEHIEQARVQLLYEALSQKVGGYYSTLRYVITGGR